MRCIEMILAIAGKDAFPVINSNMRCIEILHYRIFVDSFIDKQ